MDFMASPFKPAVRTSRRAPHSLTRSGCAALVGLRYRSASYGQVGLDVHALWDQRGKATVLVRDHDAGGRLTDARHGVGHVERAGIDRHRATCATCATVACATGSAVARV